MRSLVSALSCGVCAAALLGPGLKAQGLQPGVTVTSGNSPVVQADQTITTSGTVTISSGTSVTFQAGNTITLQNGFHATSGSSFHAFIAKPDFVINVTPTAGATVLAGGSVTYNVTVSSIFNFPGTVYFSPAGVTGLPQGATASFSASSIAPPVNTTSNPITLTITTASGITGNYAFTVVGTSLGYPNHQGTSSLSVQDFYLTLSPATYTVYTLGAATYQLSATGVNGFNNSISLYFAWNTSPSPCDNMSGFPGQIQPGAAPVTFTLYENSCGQQGTYQFTITASWNGYSRPLQGYLAILPGTGSSYGGPTVTCSASPNPAAIGQTVTFTANVAGGAAPYSYSWSGQVSGASQSVSFTPPGIGAYEASVTVTDSNGKAGSNSCSVAVQQGGNALTITTSSTLPYGAAGSAYSQTLTATGGTGSYTWSAVSTLPRGLTLSSSGVLSGTPATAGNYTFYINVADTGGHSVSSEFALTVASGGAQSSVQVSLAYPQLSGGYPGGLHKFTFHFTDPLGPTDISGGQIAFNIDTTGPDLPVCQLDWYTNGKVDITGVAYGNFGGGELSSTYCNLYTGESSLTQTAQGYDVSVVVSFPEALPNPLMPAWTRGIPKGSGTGAYGPVGVHSLSPKLIENPSPGDGSGPYCGGVITVGADLTRYSDGTLIATLEAWTDDLGFGPGWINQTGYGQLYGPYGLMADTASEATTMDYGEAIVPFSSGTGSPGGQYQVYADYTFSHPSPYCYILLDYGSGGYTDDSGTAYFPSYLTEFDIGDAAADPTPYIDSVTLDRPLVEGDTSVATIKGGNFGLKPPTLAFTCSSDNASPPCTSSDVTAVAGLCPGESTPSSCVTAVLTASSTALGDYDLNLTSNGTPTYGNFQQAPGNSAQTTKQQAVTAIQANMALQLNGYMINAQNNYSEDSTIQITAVRPDTGATITGFVGTVYIAEVANAENVTIYDEYGGSLPDHVDIMAGKDGTATFVAQSLAGPNKAENGPPFAAQIQTTNYPLQGGGTFAIPQWNISPQAKQLDPQHAAAPTYDWFEARARDLFANATGDLATVLAAVQNYTAEYLAPNGQVIGGQALTNRAAQSPIHINPFFASVRINSAGGQYSHCNQNFTHPFTEVFVHEARHAYQFSQAAIQGNDQDNDWLIRNPATVGPTTIFQDTTTQRSVCNEFSNNSLGAVFSVAYKGDGTPDPFGPGPAGDTSADVDYALELDAHTFSSSHN